MPPPAIFNAVGVGGSGGGGGGGVEHIASPLSVCMAVPSVTKILYTQVYNHKM